MFNRRETVLILDFGSQYTQLIARRCREEGVFSQIERWDWPIEHIRQLKPLGIILSGGPSSVYDKDAPERRGDMTSLNTPFLGICYGMQIMVTGEGGSVAASEKREYGRAKLEIVEESRLFRGLQGTQPVWMSHRDFVTKLPVGWREVGNSDSGFMAALENPEKKMYGLQFHPEVSHTPSGDKILRNFLFDICGAEGGWNMESFVEQAIGDVRAQVGDGKVICAFSGGVDSSVAATLVHEAIGDNLRCVLVDNGLLRKNEAAQVESVFRRRFKENLVIVDASLMFLTDLAGVTEPEEKREHIGHRFIEVFRREATKFGEANFLLQGTLYPDVIESSGTAGTAAMIKTHHNVGGLPEILGLTLLEPLRNLFKDEVRKVGLELGLPEQVIDRHPFPGPGLAVRIPGEVTREAVAILQEADEIFIEELRLAGWYERVSQALVVLLPVKTVGVKGDGRTYEQVVALRSVDTRDFMTADFSPLPHDLLARVASRIANEVDGVNRVVYDITSKPPATVEWE